MQTGVSICIPLTIQDRAGMRGEVDRKREARGQGLVSLCLHILAKNSEKYENFKFEFGLLGH